MAMDLSSFEGRLPYASELYGMYQPLLGWKSRRIVNRMMPGLTAAQDGILARLSAGLVPKVEVTSDGLVSIVHIAQRRPARNAARKRWDSLLLADLDDGFSIDLEANPAATRSEQLGLFANRMDEVLRQIEGYAGASPGRVDDFKTRIQARRAELIPNPATAEELVGCTKSLAERESLVAAVLANLLLTRGTQQDELMDLYLQAPVVEMMPRASDPLETLDPSTDLDRLVLSPIGLMHLFRQYFFEFDSFLGPSVQHVWLPPGGSLELIESTTRRTQTERMTEMTLERSRQDTSESQAETELSTAIKTENQSSTKFGMGLDSTSKFTVGVYSGQINTTTKYNADSSLKAARDETHKQRRQESSKVVQELKQSLKTSFKTVTERTDISSRRYVLQNTTKELLNYEMRRKMRHVGVQLQDLGIHLSWQSFVDDPGAELGLGQLVHIAKPPDAGAVTNPDAQPALSPEIRDSPIALNLTWGGYDGRRGPGIFPLSAPIELTAPQPGYIFARSEVKVMSAEQPWRLGARPVAGREKQVAGSTEMAVEALEVGVDTGNGGLDWDEDAKFSVELTIIWKPSQTLVAAAEANAVEQAKELAAARQQAAEQAFFEEARDRITAASKVRSRSFEELREEERTVVYRALVRQLLKDALIPPGNNALRHVLAELLEGFFDLDSMLYFVAPEWWKPRHVSAELSLGDGGGTQQQHLASGQTVSWARVDAIRDANYFITEDANPAPLGASLGWLMQLDGDNMRNAFLNAPWVKAVVPIRAGKEIAALNWLTRANVEGVDGLTGLYPGTSEERAKMVAQLSGVGWEDPVYADHVAKLDPDTVTLKDALLALALTVEEQHRVAATAIEDKELGSTYLPRDQVYEHGFKPNAGGFTAATAKPFEVFSQWIEVVPTDQIVPVSVVYDPKSGRMV
jgi:hypothetical protein